MKKGLEPGRIQLKTSSPQYIGPDPKTMMKLVNRIISQHDEILRINRVLLDRLSAGQVMVNTIPEDDIE